MGKDEHLISAEILSYIQSVGGDKEDWYVAVGISACDCLFVQHGVVRESDRWIYRKALAVDAARRVADYFQREVGTDGDREETNVNGDKLYVYAYRKAGHTTP